MIETILEQWGQPALISAIVAFIVVLVSRKLPFQQKLNEAQIRTLQTLFNALLESHRLYLNELNRVVFEYDEVLNDPEVDIEGRDRVAMEIRKRFSAPEFLRPAQELMHSFLVPSSVRRAVGEYVVVTQGLVAVCLQKTKETGGQSAWDFALRRGEEPLIDVSEAIRESLGIDELTAENRRTAGTLWTTRLARARRCWRWLIHRERPAPAYWALIYYAQTSRLQDMARKHLGAEVNGDTPEYDALFGESPRPEPMEIPDDFMEPLRQMRSECATQGASQPEEAQDEGDDSGSESRL